MLHPSIISQVEGAKIMLEYNGQQCGEIISSLQFEIRDAFYSLAYGLKAPTKKLYGCASLKPLEKK